MNILFIHQNMPGQFKHLAPALAAQDHRVVFVTKRTGIDMKGVQRASYEPPRSPSPETHKYVRMFEDAVLHGQAVVRACRDLAEDGFRPDVIVAHPGWGEALFLKDIYPKVPLLNFCEYYYSGRGADIGFDPAEKATLDDIARARARNAHLLLSLEACDAGLCPTLWQKSRHPPALQDKIRVSFDGIDTDIVRPNRAAEFKLPEGAMLTREDEVVTYVARNLEPYRGFPSFIRALPALLAARPNAQIVVVGGDDVSYGNAPPNGKTWRETMVEEVPLDLSRVHFTGKLPYARYLQVLQVSSLHIYLTYPFVLSWSCLEAMAAECLVLGSATPPVEEFVRDGENGFLVDFHSPAEIAGKAAALLDAGASLDPVRRRARQTVEERCALRVCLPEQLNLIHELLGTR